MSSPHDDLDLEAFRWRQRQAVEAAQSVAAQGLPKLDAFDAALLTEQPSNVVGGHNAAVRKDDLDALSLGYLLEDDRWLVVTGAVDVAGGNTEGRDGGTHRRRDLGGLRVSVWSERIERSSWAAGEVPQLIGSPGQAVRARVVQRAPCSSFAARSGCSGA